MKSSTEIERPLLFVDTWGWIVLADARDPRHDEVVALRRKHTENGILVTSDYVLDETFTRLFGGSPFQEAELFCSAVLRARDAGMVRVEPSPPSVLGGRTVCACGIATNPGSHSRI